MYTIYINALPRWALFLRYTRSKSHNATSRADFSSNAVSMKTTSGREKDSLQSTQKNVE